MKKILSVTLILAAAALVMVGCNFGKTYSTQISGMGFCSEFTTTDLEAQEMLASANYKEEACSRDDVVGICTIESDFVDATGAIIYYDSEFTSAEAEDLCDGMDGKFTEK